MSNVYVYLLINITVHYLANSLFKQLHVYVFYYVCGFTIETRHFYKYAHISVI